MSHAGPISYVSLTTKRGRPEVAADPAREADRAILDALREGRARRDGRDRGAEALAAPPPSLMTEVDVHDAEAAETRAGPPRQRILRLRHASPRAMAEFHAALAPLLDDPASPVDGVGADAPIGLADYAQPGGPGHALFGDADDAMALINAAALARHGLDGAGVNVVVVDMGFDVRQVPGIRFGGGWQKLAGLPEDPYDDVWVPRGPRLPDLPEAERARLRYPGVADPRLCVHGAMMAQNIARIAPRATLHDAPLVPLPEGAGITPLMASGRAFLSDAEALFWAIDARIRAVPPWERGSWVIANPWAVFDRRRWPGTEAYTEGPVTAHALNRRIRAMTRRGIDFVFCAGNCGQFCPDGRCGPDDIGPGESLVGANAHPDVLSVGAVRTDGMWLGYSSQGPGTLYAEKPDLCAPSHFAEAGDDYARHVGTSAASAVATGVVAALRSGWPAAEVPTPLLWQALRESARGAYGGPRRTHDPQSGYGVIDAEAAVARLSALHGPPRRQRASG
jgi:hypothetical protein